MTHDTILSRGLIALTLTLGVAATAVCAEAFQPLPRLAVESTYDPRRLEPLPPATQPLPRPAEVAQSDTGSLQEALRLLESRVESGAFDSAPNANVIEEDEQPARAPAAPLAPRQEADIPVSAPQPPVTPAPPIMPTVPTSPVAPEPVEPIAAPIEAADARPENLSPPSPMIETPAEEPSPTAPTAAETLPAMTETPAVAAEAPTPVPSPDAASEDAGRSLSETAPQTRTEPVADERIADAPQPIAPEAGAERWQVQLLAGRSLSRVERDRDDIRRFHGDRFADLTLTISQSSPNGLYRLRALDWPSRAEADAWCRNLRAATGLQCMAVRGTETPDPVSIPADTSPSPATR